MMTDPPDTSFGDEVCPICGNPKTEHNSQEIMKCSKQLVEEGIVRYCATCGLTKPADGIHDRCGKCGEKYSFSNE